MKLGLFKALAPTSALFLLGCSDAPNLPDRVELIAEEDLAELVDQCSRSEPEKFDDSWQPTASDVVELEARLAQELPGHLKKVAWAWPVEKDAIAKFPEGFWREYGGIVRGGRRYIYGNLGPVAEEENSLWDPMGKGPSKICDGGPRYFGVEYDIRSKTFTHVAFNGPLG